MLLHDLSSGKSNGNRKKKTMHDQVIVRIGVRYRGSFNPLVFGEIKPYRGSLKDGRLDLIYCRDPGWTVGGLFPLWTLSLARRPRPLL
jgi:hypothetical protein